MGENVAYYDGRKRSFCLIRDRESTSCFSAKQFKLSGRHNYQNTAACILAADILGASHEKIKKVISSFDALAHRLERVYAGERLHIINDSKSTNVASVLAAMDMVYMEYRKWSVVLLVGGQDKGSNWEELVQELRGVDVICFGRDCQVHI